MNKKKMIIIIISVILVLGIVLGCLLFFSKKESLRTITIDINPSIELVLTKDNKVKKITPLTEDGKEFTRDEWQGIKLDEYLDRVAERVVELHLDKDQEVVIILGMDKKDNKIEESIQKAFEKQKINANIIVPILTEKAKKEAKEHHITPAKAAYILDLISENEVLQFDDLKDVSAVVLNEMKETGLYCERGYTLLEGMCEGKIKEEDATEGDTCPQDYELVNGKCYKTYGVQEELYCENGFTLKGKMCSGEEVIEASRRCDTGTINEETKMCEDYTFVSEGTKYCNGDGKISQKGTCSYGKPLINGGCIGSDVVIDGWCYNMIDGGSDYALINCPSGSSAYDGENGRACYSKTTTSPTYYCEGKLQLNGTKCSGHVEKDANRKFSCLDGYTLLEDRVCINYQEEANTVIGLTCPKEARLENNKCSYYERIPAKEK